jgi:beta-glucosidase
MGLECDDMIERHPRGLEAALLNMHRQWGLPMYLTEHGSSSTDEAFRERDLRENLASLHRAIVSGVDMRGFYYWSLLDNFEWQFGYSKKFGLLSVDFSNDQRPRTMKALGRTYGTICSQNAIPANWDSFNEPNGRPVRLPQSAPAQTAGQLRESPAQ